MLETLHPAHQRGPSAPSSSPALAERAARQVATAGVARIHHADGAYGRLLVAELLAGPWAEVVRPLLVVVPDEEQARQAAADLSFFLADPELLDPGAALLARPRVEVLAPIDVSPYGGLNPDRAAQQA